MFFSSHLSRLVLCLWQSDGWWKVFLLTAPGGTRPTLLIHDSLKAIIEIFIINFSLLTFSSIFFYLFFCRLKLECEKLASEKTEMQRHYVMVSERAKILLMMIESVELLGEGGEGDCIANLKIDGIKHLNIISQEDTPWHLSSSMPWCVTGRSLKPLQRAFDSFQNANQPHECSSFHRYPSHCTFKLTAW